MTKHFERELDKIKKQVLSLGALVEERVHMAAEAIESLDAQIARNPGVDIVNNPPSSRVRVNRKRRCSNGNQYNGNHAGHAPNKPFYWSLHLQVRPQTDVQAKVPVGIVERMCEIELYRADW